jgi:hypothetical protein
MPKRPRFRKGPEHCGGPERVLSPAGVTLHGVVRVSLGEPIYLLVSCCVDVGRAYAIASGGVRGGVLHLGECDHELAVVSGAGREARDYLDKIVGLERLNPAACDVRARGVPRGRVTAQPAGRAPINRNNGAKDATPKSTTGLDSSDRLAATVMLDEER